MSKLEREAERDRGRETGRETRRGAQPRIDSCAFCVYVLGRSRIRCKQQEASASSCTDASGGEDSASSCAHNDERRSYPLSRAVDQSGGGRRGRQGKQDVEDVAEGTGAACGHRVGTGGGWHTLARRILEELQQEGRRRRVATRLKLFEIYTSCTSSCDTEEIEDEDMYEHHGFPKSRGSNDWFTWQHRTAFSRRRGSPGSEGLRERGGVEESKSQNAATLIGVEVAGRGAGHLGTGGEGFMEGEERRNDDAHHLGAWEMPVPIPKSQKEVAYISHFAPAPLSRSRTHARTQLFLFSSIPASHSMRCAVLSSASAGLLTHCHRRHAHGMPHPLPHHRLHLPISSSSHSLRANQARFLPMYRHRHHRQHYLRKMHQQKTRTLALRGLLHCLQLRACLGIARSVYPCMLNETRAATWRWPARKRERRLEWEHSSGHHEKCALVAR